MGNKLIVACLSLLFFTMCESSNELDTLSTNCAAVTCAVQMFSVEIRNAEGTNLITNGTYPLGNSTVFKGNQKVNTASSAEDTAINFFLSGIKGLNTYKITLNNTETDILVLNLKVENMGSECCGQYFLITDAKYNGNPIEIIREKGMLDRIVIVK